ncbi:MAG: HD domain-containing protein [Ignavibacteria bacterium]|nr:HD domain-containing protein [Ignavibacteria bacterium]
MNKKIEIKEPILKKIGKIADKNNIDVYVVGGYVRDYLLGKLQTDIDCTVCGDSIEFAKIVAKEFNSKVIIYERFRTALIPIGNRHIEFVGTRKETYNQNSRKPITEEGTLEDDLKRRDFTVNAMAASINSKTSGEIVDLFNGYEHLQQKLLITPLDPMVTFSEDPLRMMRAARFAAQLDFTVSDDIIEAMTKLANRISIVSQERITDELMKSIATQKPSIAFFILKKTALLDKVFPELSALQGVESVETKDGRKFAHKDVLNHSLKVLDNIALKTDNIWLRFTALVHDIGKLKTKRFIENSGWHFFGHEEVGAKMMKNIFKKLKLPLEHLDYVELLVRLHLRPMQLVDGEVTDSAVRRLAFQAGGALEDLFTLCRSDITSNNPNLTQQYLNNYDIVAQKVIEIQEKDKLREFQSPVRGEEIMEICNIPPSKLVGVIKSNIENAILDCLIPNEYETAKQFFLENKDKWIEEYEQNMKKNKSSDKD